MNKRTEWQVLPVFALLLLVASVGVRADSGDELARDVARVESLRTVKDLQRSYAQYTQAGLWTEAAGLFTSDARFIRGTEQLQGAQAIEGWLARRAGGQPGLPSGALHIEFIDEPLVNLAPDGRSAKGRWMSLTLQGDGKGQARIEGGIYENEYRRDGDAWKIAVSHYHAQYSGPYETGWTNEGGADLPIIPYHFTIEESGIPIPAATGAASRSNATPADISARISRLNAEDAVRNLQHAFGYYVDRRMWDDALDLFARYPVAEVADTSTTRGMQGGVFQHREGVRRVLERMGPAGLSQGVLNDRLMFDTMVRILPDGEAIARGFELAMVGDAAKGTQHWEVSVFRNRFVMEDGLWKLQELRLFPLVKAQYAHGWGDGGQAPPSNRAIAAFIGNHPVTGKPVATHGLEVLAAKNITGAVAAYRKGQRTEGRWNSVILEQERRRLARSLAWDGTENISSAYGYYIDDFHWPNLGAVFAEKGNKQSPFAGYYFGRERITQAATSRYGAPRTTPRAGIAMHWRIQPVIYVAADGRSANLRTRLFEPVTAKQAGSAQIMSGMYPNDQTVLENGIWRLWSLEIDEPYFTMAGWKGGWSGVKPAAGDAPRPPPSPLVASYPPDILMTDLGRRAEGFRGGTGKTIEWPGILPMWFNYRNPVSGREPPQYWPDCVPCELRPEASMTRHGYLMPPTGPQR